MKVERITEKKFEPIVITLETEEEAERLWHILNIPMSSSMSDYLNDEGMRDTTDAMSNFLLQLFERLDELYTPKEYGP